MAGVVTFGLLVGTYLLFGLFVASGAWVPVAGLLAAVLGAAMVLYDLRLVAFVLLVGVPTVFVFPNNVIGGIPFATVDRAMFVAIFAGLALDYIFDKRRVLRIDALEAVVLFFLVWLVITFVPTVVDKSLATIRKDLALFIQGYVMPLTAMMLAARIRWRPGDIDLTIGLLIGVALFLVGIGVLQYFFGIGLFTPRYIEIIQEGRTAGTFSSAVEYGGVLVACSFLALCRFVRSDDSLARAVLLACVGAMLAGLVLSLTRAPMVAFAAGALLLFVADRRIRPLMVTAGAVVVVAGLAALPFILDFDALLARLQDVDPIYNRLTLYATGLNMLVHHPILGVGFGRTGFADAKAGYITTFFAGVDPHYAVDPGVPHNEYLHVAILAGIPGVLLYLLIFWLCYRTLRRIQNNARLSSGLRDFALYVRAFLVSYVVLGMFSDIAFLNYLGILLFFLIGMAKAMQASETAVAWSSPAERAVPIGAPSRRSRSR